MTAAESDGGRELRPAEAEGEEERLGEASLTPPEAAFSASGPTPER